jgi:hypothetical protein
VVFTNHWNFHKSRKENGEMTTKRKVMNVFEAILKYGHDEDFVPVGGEDFMATDAPAGSDEKIDVLRRRVEMGMPLWHGEDRRDYSGLTGAVRPRE